MLCVHMAGASQSMSPAKPTVTTLKTKMTASNREEPHFTSFETTGSSRYAMTPAMANGTRIGCRKASTRKPSQISPMAMVPMVTTATAVRALQSALRCQGVGSSSWFIAVLEHAASTRTPATEFGAEPPAGLVRRNHRLARRRAPLDEMRHRAIHPDLHPHFHTPRLRPRDV